MSVELRNINILKTIVKILQNMKLLLFYNFLIPIFFVFTCSYTAASVSIYPDEEWQTSTPEVQGMQSELLADMMEYINDNSLHINSLLIIRNGYLVLDAYFWPFAKGQKHHIRSCTKSIMSALIGIAIDKGYIKDINQPVIDFFPDKNFAYMEERKKSITLENLLMMASGLECRDSYLYRWRGLVQMRNSGDWTQHILDLPMAEPPGERFEYCNGASHLLSAIIQHTTKMKTLDFARQHLFEPIGIRDVDWPTSPQEVNIGYGQMQLIPHDMARFGWLYLNKGRWGNRQIVPSEWVEASTIGRINATFFDQYGYQWWIDLTGYYAAIGYKGQRIFVVPEKNIVAVFTSDLVGPEFRRPKYILESFIIPAAVSSKALPPNPVKKARLDDLLVSASIAPPKGYIWTSEAEGMAKDGVFNRTAAPAFTFAYPSGSKKAGIRFPGQIMRMKTPDDVFFTASVSAIPGGMKLEDFGPSGYAAWLADLATNIRVVSNKEITLKCGTKAYRTDLTYLWKNFMPITTILVTAYKNGKYIYVDAHKWKHYQEIESIAQSMRFK